MTTTRPTDARAVVMARLAELYDTYAAEQAVEFEGGWSSWGQLGHVRDGVATALAGRGLPDAAPIAVLMRQRPALVASELAVMALGHTALLVTPLQADAALAAEIERVAPAVLVAHAADWTRPGLVEAVRAAGTLGLEVTDDFTVAVRVDVGALRPVDGLDAAVTVLTSGTTGAAKRLPVAWATFVRIGGGPKGRPAESGRGALILSLPLVTLGGLLSMTRLVFAGRPMAMMERFDVHTWAALVREHRPKVMGAPPPVVKMILDAGISPDHFEGVTAYMTSSAPIAPEVIGEFERRYGIPVLLGYGATEFLASVTGWTAELWSEFGPAKVGSVGRAYPGVALRVVDPETGGEVPTDHEGILEVDPPERAGNLPAGWLRTTDRARIDADGFLWILGRADDVIIRGGFKVDLKQVEAALLAHPAVSGACAVGVSDERVGTVPAAIVTVRATGASSGDAPAAPAEAELIAWVRERVPPYAVPVSVRVVDAIPQTSTLKVHRDAVRRLLSD